MVLARSYSLLLFITSLKSTLEIFEAIKIDFGFDPLYRFANSCFQIEIDRKSSIFQMKLNSFTYHIFEVLFALALDQYHLLQ